MRIWLAVVLGLWLPGVVWGAVPITHARVDRTVAVFDVNRDLTYTRTETTDKTLETERGVRGNDRAGYTFYPEHQAVELVEAWVDQPDGTRVPVAKGSIFTRPSAASQSAPGFASSMTTTVVFPQLRPGSRTHVVWHFTQKTPPLLGFNAFSENEFSWDTGLDDTQINIPADVPLHWQGRGFTVEDKVADGMRHLSARIENTRGREAEPSMVNSWDFMPLFIVTSLPGPEAIGSIIYRESAGRAEVTPEIAALAVQVAGERTGLEAARALHAWVATHIRYVAVYLNPDEGYIPHPAAEVLKAGYGDCKDYVVLMQALLAARGIEAQMAVLNWGTRFGELPMWTPYFANHAILYLPQFNHYVNPTDRYAGFDALDRELSGKTVVLITPEGKVDHTPEATPAANRYHYDADLTLDRDGAIAGTARYEMAPNAEISIRNILTAVSSLDDLARRLLARTSEGGFGSFAASDPRDLLKPLTLSASWRSLLAVNEEGGQIFLRVPGGPDLYSASEQRGKLSASSTRTTPMMAGVTDSEWSTLIHLPAGMTVARLPPDVALETPAGRYSAQYHNDGDAVRVSRRLVISREVVPPELYPEFERLLYAPLVDTRAIIVLQPGPS